MDFGRVPDKELNKIDFSLPDEPSFNKKILTGKKKTKPLVYLGCAKWGRKEWIGKIYPRGTREEDFLEHYVQHYNSIELNAAGYKIPSVEQIRSWGMKAKNKDFLFCPKMVRYIVPAGNLKRELELTRTYIKAVKAFGKNLGPVFLMLGENYPPSKKEMLFDYLESFPVGIQLFLEVRHPEWYSNKKQEEELFEKLKKLKIGIVITDTAGRRDCCHMHLTIPKAFIRFVGNSLHDTDYNRCNAWVKRIRYWLDHGLNELYFFMHMHDKANSPELTIYLVEKLNTECKLNLIKPQFVS